MTKEVNRLNGWLVIDKPLEMGSTQVVSKLKRLFKPAKIGHAGTLDPLATGVLPIAFGKATRLIPYVMEGLKTYEFEVMFGSETQTDDLEGDVISQSSNRPTQEDVERMVPSFTGQILQRPPLYSALKVNGQRAYHLARHGMQIELPPRPVFIKSLKLIRFCPDWARFQVVCGKGTYVRSLGRDIGRCLGCFGHISYLRRTACGPFNLEQSISLAKLENMAYNDRALNILPLETALDDILVLAVEAVDVHRLARGMPVLPQGIQAVPEELKRADVLRAMFQDQLVALVKYDKGFFKPFRVFWDSF